MSHRATELAGEALQESAPAAASKLKAAQQVHEKGMDKWEEKKDQATSVLRHLVWGADPNEYNYCSETLFGAGPLAFTGKTRCKEKGFILMQAMRAVHAFLCLCVGLVFAFIYMRAAGFYYCFWSILLTGLAFVFLLMGTGKQVVYQQLLDQCQGKEGSQSIQWQLGVFFYSMAFPFAITANVLYFSKYEWIRSSDEKSMFGSETAKWLIPQYNKDYRQDIDQNLKVLYYRLESEPGRHSVDWRSDFMVYAHLVPLVCLCCDFMMNRIKMRGWHFLHNLGFTGLYFATAYFYSALSYGQGVYGDNLRWVCTANQYYQYDKYASTDGTDHRPASLVIDNHLHDGTCRTYQPDAGTDRDLQCKMMSNFYCPQNSTNYDDPEKDIEYMTSLTPPMQPWHPWANAFFMMTVIVVVSVLSFVLLYFLHRAKLCGSKAFHHDPKKNLTYSVKKHLEHKQQEKLNQQMDKEGPFFNIATVNDLQEPLLDNKDKKDQ